jgi:Tfp pilus assembly protein PilF
MYRPRLIPLVVLIFAATTLFAQARRPPAGGNPGGTGRPGNPNPTPTMNVPNTSSGSRMTRLDVQLTSDGTRPLAIQALVQISLMSGGTVQENYTDMDGRVSFSVPPADNYQVRVSGPGIETSRSSFEMFAGESYHRESVVVKLTEEGTKNLPGGMISAAMLNVPAKARHEYDKGMELMQKGKLEDARKHLQKATEIYPSFDWAFNNIGVIDMRTKDVAGAREAFTRAVTINNKNFDADRNLARLELGENNYEGAGKLLQDALTARPGDPEALGMLSFTEFKTKQFDRALSDAEKVHQDGRDAFPIAHLVAASVRESKGDLAGAQKQYEMYLKEAPDSPQAQVAKQGLERIQAQAKN